MVAVWTVWALGCVAVLFLRPGEETIPYHLGWAGFALAFGLTTWSRVQLVTAMAWYTLASGVALERGWLLGRIGWDETTEIPLMFLLTLLMVWHVRRRQSALGHVTRMAEREVRACLDREQLMRLTSHELRTPLTIARGYVELLQTRAAGLENQQDLSVVADEIERLSRVSERLVRVIRLQDDTTSEMFDIDEVMAQAVERWRVVEDRRWVLETGAGRFVGSPERVRTGLDTLVENAIRYTSVGDTIRLTGIRQLEHVLVGVYDSGRGLTDEQITAINTGADLLPGVAAGTTSATLPGLDTEDGLRGTGLGLSIVRALAHARGGSLQAAHAPEGGAAMVITLPLQAPCQADALVSEVVDEPPTQETPPTERYAAAMVVVPDVIGG
ncbi:MAG: HAMP domain-containing sensor histidine kinase [Actinomycetota bacterium]